MKISDNLSAFLWDNPMANNCNTFLMAGKKNILVDPGHDHLFDHVIEGLSTLQLTVNDIDFVIITHGHPDHIEAVKRFIGTSAIILISEREMSFVRSLAPYYAGAFDRGTLEPEILLREGDMVIGDMNFEVLHTPGHSPGSVCLYWKDKRALFTGDVIFNQGVGRTDLPGGEGRSLKESIKRLSLLQAEYLLPGHGDIVSGRERVNENFQNIMRTWFAYL